MIYKEEDVILVFLLGFAASFLANYFYSKLSAEGRI
jgi:hypothetical protein